MRSDPAEYKEIVAKLLDKTRQRKVEWKRAHANNFRCTLPAPDASFLEFTVLDDEGQRVLRMSDQDRNTIFVAKTNDLPTSPEEEEASQMIEEIYDNARRQALRVEDKLDLASTLLDRV